jgi:uncharacterized protein (DUF1015 family)
MPKINAFKGIRPALDKTLQVVAKPFDQFYTEEAKKILQQNSISFLHTIEPLIDNPYLRGSREEIIFKKAKDFFEDFLENSILVQDSKEAIYIYRTFNKGHWQTGIWCITAIDDYLDNTLRKHEHTRAEREKDLIEYLDNTGIDANPVLVTYAGTPVIQSIINKTITEKPLVDFFADEQEHQLWMIDEEETIKTLLREFASLPASYIADGHHRAAAASLAGIQRRKNNLKHRGTEDYNFFTTLYFTFDQLLVYEFQRLVKDLNGLSVEEFLDKLKLIFEVTEIPASKPSTAHVFHLYLEQKWYALTIPEKLLNISDEVARLDVSILQDKILNPILGIEDPRRDKRIKFVGGVLPIEEVIKLVDEGEMKLAFFLYPTSIDELIDVADAGNVMPPKSTWFEPKLHCGLLIHKVD